MIHFTQIISFLLPTLLLNITPGPDMLFVIGQCQQGGIKCAIKATGGLALGYLWHILLVSFGLAAILAQLPQALFFFKFLGGAYLLFLGFKMLLSKDHSNRKSQTSSLWSGFLVSASNPKVAVFFLAFLPQFVQDDAGPPTLQLILLGLVFCLTSTLVNLSAGALSQAARLGKGRNQLFTKLCGVMMVGMAARLAFSR